MTDKIGFIGLGQMGKWMAANLVKRNFDLTVFDKNDKAVGLLADQGARPAKSAAQLATGVDLIILCLPDSNVVADVVGGKEGVLQSFKPGLILIDCGTSDYLWTGEFAQSLEKRKIRFADAPVTGMEQRARDAALTIMYGGPEQLLEEIRPVLEAMGNEIVHMGGVGSGQLSKMINNILFNANLAALAEVLPMAVKLGLDPEKIAKVINTGSGQSFASKTFIPNILEGRFDKGYPLQNAYKDLVSAAEVSTRHKIPLPMVHTAATTYQMALASGWGRADKGAMVKVFEGLLGVKFRSKEN
jgi:3-hydroxyisobutyrate dehydrogenase-like beta-hydroxyacid dehydrogenase